ncbi:MAG: hypothetical protein HYW50_02955 [Candidatus Diapherotrites archaeon]|nr:hypothetical protein [Candidatus Diapherotrites archaeon]
MVMNFQILLNPLQEGNAMQPQKEPNFQLRTTIERPQSGQRGEFATVLRCRGHTGCLFELKEVAVLPQTAQFIKKTL